MRIFVIIMGQQRPRISHHMTPSLGSSGIATAHGSLRLILIGNSTSLFLPYLQYRSKPSFLTPNDSTTSHRSQNSPTASHRNQYLFPFSKFSLQPLLSSNSSATSLLTVSPTLTSSHPSQVATTISPANMLSGWRGRRTEALDGRCGIPESGVQVGVA